MLILISKQLPSTPNSTADNYENIQLSYKQTPPANGNDNRRSLPDRPIIVYSKTLSLHSDIDGVPFVLNPRLAKATKHEVRKINYSICRLTRSKPTVAWQEQTHLNRTHRKSLFICINCDNNDKTIFVKCNETYNWCLTTTTQSVLVFPIPV